MLSKESYFVVSNRVGQSKLDLSFRREPSELLSFTNKASSRKNMHMLPFVFKVGFADCGIVCLLNEFLNFVPDGCKFDLLCESVLDETIRPDQKLEKITTDEFSFDTTHIHLFGNGSIKKVVIE